MVTLIDHKSLAKGEKLVEMSFSLIDNLKLALISLIQNWGCGIPILTRQDLKIKRTNT